MGHDPQMSRRRGSRSCRRPWSCTSNRRGSRASARAARSRSLCINAGYLFPALPLRRPSVPSQRRSFHVNGTVGLELQRPIRPAAVCTAGRSMACRSMAVAGASRTHSRTCRRAWATVSAQTADQAVRMSVRRSKASEAQRQQWRHPRADLPRLWSAVGHAVPAARFGGGAGAALWERDLAAALPALRLLRRRVSAPHCRPRAR